MLLWIVGFVCVIWYYRLFVLLDACVMFGLDAGCLVACYLIVVVLWYVGVSGLCLLIS